MIRLPFPKRPFGPLGQQLCSVPVIALAIVSSLPPLFGAASVHAAAVVGGWDATRGGPYSLNEGTNTAALRGLLTTVFPGTTFTGTSTLTAVYLATVDVVVIQTAFTDFIPITPLSAAEQTALHDFIIGGGNAVLLGERTGFSPLVNPTLMNPFGLNIDGNLLGTFPANVTDPAGHALTNGPFGLVTSITTLNPGWFDQLGSSRSLATLSTNGQSPLAVLNAGDLAPGSGRVVLAADSDMFVSSSNLTLIQNGFAWIVPEPSAVITASFGALYLVGYVWARRRRQA